MSEQDPLKAITGQVAQFLMDAEVVVAVAVRATGGGSAREIDPCATGVAHWCSWARRCWPKSKGPTTGS